MHKTHKFQFQFQMFETWSPNVWTVMSVLVCWSLKSVAMERCAGCCRCCFFTFSTLLLLPPLLRRRRQYQQQKFFAFMTNCFWQTVFLNPACEKINYHRRRVLIVKCADHKNKFNLNVPSSCKFFFIFSFFSSFFVQVYRIYLGVFYHSLKTKFSSSFFIPMSHCFIKVWEI